MPIPPHHAEANKLRAELARIGFAVSEAQALHLLGYVLQHGGKRIDALEAMAQYPRPFWLLPIVGPPPSRVAAA